jgi:hypothetical protein
LVELLDGPAIDELAEDIGQIGLRVDAVKLGGLDARQAQLCRRGRRTGYFFDSTQSRSHSAHVGQDVVIQYRWHPLYGRSVRRIQGERRASGDFVHVELSPGAVTTRRNPSSSKLQNELLWCLGSPRLMHLNAVV